MEVTVKGPRTNTYVGRWKLVIFVEKVKISELRQLQLSIISVSDLVSEV